MEADPKPKRVLKRILLAILTFVLIAAVGFVIYISTYSKATTPEVTSTQEVTVTRKDGLRIFSPKDQPGANTEDSLGIIFYPGGKVDSAAYEPLMEQLAERGVTAVIVDMPFHLAVFGVNRADKVFEDVPNVRLWYIGGHSLGGAMSSKYLAQYPERFEGLILLGAYPAEVMNRPVIQIVGSNDQVLDKSKLSTSAKTVTVEGGNHAQFGDYGKQKGDGEATISRDDQQKQTVDAIMEFIKESKGLPQK